MREAEGLKLIEIERDNNILEENTQERYLLHLHGAEGYRITWRYSGKVQDLQITSEEDKTAKRVRAETYRQEHERFKSLIDDEINDYELIRSAEDKDSALYQNICFQILALRQLKITLELIEQEENEREQEDEDIGTATAREIREQNGEE